MNNTLQDFEAAIKEIECEDEKIWRDKDFWDQVRIIIIRNKRRERIEALLK